MAKKPIDKAEVKEKLSNVAKGVGAAGTAAVEKAKETAVKAKEVAEGTKDEIMRKLDVNGDGAVDAVDIILIALKVPGVKINRADFLRKELFKNHPEEVIQKAISSTPANAGIASEEVDKIADEVIKFERNAVSGISLALGMPGGIAMAATIPADIAQYYGYMLRAAQKMLYLYGFPEIDTSDEAIALDTETVNSLTICLGIMYGVAGANNAIKAMAKALATGVEKKLLNAALTKGTIYPIVKSVAKWFSVRMTKDMFAGFFKKSIPVIGGVIGGGITYASFKPCSDRLKDALKDTMLSNPKHQSTEGEDFIFGKITNEIIDADVIDDTDEENGNE